ncbi:MAG: hypothetical protein PHC43_06505, partial [Candidatus Marinimicrobia bacterium]|nr:hypothetical protein [Candidatus Neomarinimicrobiota bacterium]
MKRLIIIIGIASLFANYLFSDDEGPFLTLRVNGHSHQVKDVISEKLCNNYQEVKEDIEDYVNKIALISRCSFGGSVERLSFKENGTNNQFVINAFIYDNFLIWTFVPITFDLKISLSVRIETIDSICFVIENATLFTYNYNSPILLAYSPIHYLLFAVFNDLPIEISAPNSLVGEKHKIFDPTKDAKAFGGQLVNDDSLNLEQENQNLIRSVPFSVDINIGKSGFIIDLDYLHGYYLSDGTFNACYSSVQPDPITSPQIEKVGFSPLYFGLNKAYSWNTDFASYTEAERAVDVLNFIDDMGMNQCRIEVPWNKIVSSIPTDEYGELPPIDGNLIDAYITQIENEGGFQIYDQIIEYTKNNTSIVPYIVVGCGHRDRMPLYGNTGKMICPGTPRGENPSNYQSISNNLYLYWLTKYTRAVVRRYKSSPYLINIFQIENELNAARQAEVFDYYRMGSSWADEAFQDQVIQTLYQAIKAELPGISSKVVHDFHIFNMAKRLKDWKNYYDVVGINFCPNDVMGEPVLGFMIGETVWAVRRIMKYLNLNKSVWVTETAYPSAYYSDPSYTVANQNQY